MTKVTNVNLESNNLDFLNPLLTDKYPVTVLFREHFKEHSPLRTLSELHFLETRIHEFKRLKKVKEYTMVLWVLRCSIFSILEFPTRKEKHMASFSELEVCLSSFIGEQPLSISRKIEKMINAYGYKDTIKNCRASVSLMNICLNLQILNSQKIKFK